MSTFKVIYINTIMKLGFKCFVYKKQNYIGIYFIKKAFWIYYIQVKWVLTSLLAYSFKILWQYLYQNSI